MKILFTKSYLLVCNNIGLMSRVLANGLEDQGSIPCRVIPKTLTPLNTHHYKVCIKGKVGQSGEWSSALPCTSV